MAIKLNSSDVVCRVVDDDTAVIRIQNQTYILDYSFLVDLLMNLAQITSQMENENSTVLENGYH